MIYKRDQHWHMDVMINGVRYREALKTTDWREAQRLEKKRVAEIQEGKGASKSGREFARKRFQEAAESFLQDRVGHVAERTIQFEKERLKPLTAFFTDKMLMRIRTEDIKTYQRLRLNAGRSGKTVNMEIGVLRLMMKRAGTWNLVADEVKMFPKRVRTVGKALSPEQKTLLFKVAASRDDWMVAHCAAVLAVSTTCRSVELKGSRWRDVDLFEQTLTVKRSKNDAGHRTIPLNGDAMAALARLRERAELEGSEAPDHFVFPACENGHIDPHKAQKSWRSAWRSLVRKTARISGRSAAKTALESGGGIGQAKSAWKRAAEPFRGFRFHDLRHQAITELSEAGASDATLMAVAGHLTREMLEHYSHVRMAAKRDALAKLESGLIPSTRHVTTTVAENVN